MWVESKAWQDCTESDHRGSGEKPLLLPPPSPQQGPGGWGRGGYWPLAKGWENTPFVQDSQEMAPNPVGISPQAGSTTLPRGRGVGGGAMGSPADLIGQAQQTAVLATPQG